MDDTLEILDLDSAERYVDGCVLALRGEEVDQDLGKFAQHLAWKHV